MAKNKKAVGKSERSMFKHSILNAEVGRLAGVMTLGRWKVPCNGPVHLVDLCAGDGVPLDGEDGMSSPEILIKHGDFIVQHDQQCRVYLVERARSTFKTLKSNVESGSHSVSVEMILGDSGKWPLPEFSSSETVFIHMDPNNVAHVRKIVTPEVISNMTQYTTMLSTLGCNAGGVGRNAREHRIAWKEHVEILVSVSSRWHDNLLVSLEGDGHKWAYLIRVPEVWVDETAKNIQRLADRHSPYPISIISNSLACGDFSAKLSQLFTNKGEASV